MNDKRYSHVESRKKEGAHYTPEYVADFISEKIIGNATLGTSLTIADPAIGDGELLIGLIKSLKNHAIENIIAYGFDTNATSLKITRDRIKTLYPTLNLTLVHKDFLQVCLEKGFYDTQIIFGDSEIPSFDLLIANPPYIRAQVLGVEQSRALSKTFGLKGHIDIYQAFIVAMKAVLKPDGVAGVIVSNRFLTTKGAGKFREIIHNQYSIKGIWDFGDTKVFSAAVLPAVMVLSPCTKQKNLDVQFSSVYMSSSDDINAPFVENQTAAFTHEGIVSSKRGVYNVKKGRLSFDSTPSDLWRLQEPESEKWLTTVARNTWLSFKDIGKIRVGVKTTADNVFIRADWKTEVGYEPELLRPITTHHVADRFRCKKIKKKSILYTHTVVEGKSQAYNIDDYPLSKKYLEDNRVQLEGRKYVIDAHKNWFELWVPQNPSLWKQPKIIFRDITERPTFWMDTEGTVVNGDCYWMVSDNSEAPENILWLILAIANSQFIEDFYDIKFQNKLYSNKRRFITQYVEHFPIPDPNLKESKQLMDLAQQSYKEIDTNKRNILESTIDNIVWSIFNVTSCRVNNISPTALEVQVNK